MQLHELQPKTKRTASRRVGRGGKRGKTSGRGGKGQTARAGGGPRPEMRDIIKKIPKLRGFGKNRARTVNAERVRPVVVNLSVIETHCPAGSEVTPKTLTALGVVKVRGGRAPSVKILGNGTLSKKISVSGCVLSASAKKKIEAAGGTVV